MANPIDKTLIVAGHWRHDDFADVVATLPGHTRFCDSIDGRIMRARTDSADVLVLAQARRQEFSREAIHYLRASFPNSIPVHLLSSHCEGEMRSGQPLTDWNRVYWYHWPSEFARILAESSRGEVTIWQSPPVDEMPQRIAARLKELPGGRCLTIGVVARCVTSWNMFSDACLAFGHQVLSLDLTNPGVKFSAPVDSCLIDADSLDGWLIDVAGRLKRSRRLTRIVVAMNFARRFEVDALRRLIGKRLRVVGKPFELFELQQAFA